MTTVLAWTVYAVIAIVAAVVGTMVWREWMHERVIRRAHAEDDARVAVSYLRSLHADQPHTVPTPTLRRGPDGRFLPRG
jgi:hypothetical protein